MKPESLNRLQALRVNNDTKGLQMAEERDRFDALKTRHEDGTAPRAVAAFNLFQTPPEVAQRMAGIVHNHTGDGARILEPSAGLGRILTALTLTCNPSEVVLVENALDCVKELYAMTEDGSARLLPGDFLAKTPAELGTFDAVCMNPPFKMGRDIKHISHALKMLKSGGILVSLCFNGTKQNEKLKPLCNSWEELPKGSFKGEGTLANIAIITIVKE